VTITPLCIRRSVLVRLSWQKGSFVPTFPGRQCRAARRRLVLLIFLLGVSLPAAPQDIPEKPGRKKDSVERLAPFVPTPSRVVEKMLKLARVEPDDVVYDLGSGDGRIVIMAAQKFGARAVGIEIDDKLVKESRERIAQLGLGERAQIWQGNMFDADLQRATVVTLYQLTVVNERLRPLLEKSLRSGTRIVCNEYRIPDWEPDKVVKVTSDVGLSYTIYLYIRP
jgi:precorrin-6B methylase 2